MSFGLLDSGSYEGFKGGVHGAALGLAGVMGLYNAAAWLRRRERHLAINAVLYSAVTAWEYQHVRRHMQALPAQPSPVELDGPNPVEPPFAA